MVKAVFFDVDGTLLSFNTHSVSKLAMKALHELKEQGIKVFIATGRSYEQVSSLFDFPFDGYITSNGSVCLTGLGAEIQRATLPKEDLQNLVKHQRLDRRAFAFSYMTASGIYCNHWSEDLVNHFDLINVKKPSPTALSSILETDIYQMTVYVGKEKEFYLQQHIMPNCEFTRWHESFADVNNKRYNKATGVQMMLNYHDIDLRHTVAFGDGGNDIKMLQYVAHGVAMGNASADVKAEARYVTDSVDEDGVWNALVRMEVLKAKVYES